MGNFLEYLDDFDKNMEQKIIREQAEIQKPSKKKVKKKFVIKKKRYVNENNDLDVNKATSILQNFMKENTGKESPESVSQAVKVLQSYIDGNIDKIEKKETITENEVDRATAILDGIDEAGSSGGMPLSTRFYDDSGKVDKSVNNQSITEAASDLLGGDSSVEIDGVADLPPESRINTTARPLMEVPKMDEEMLKHVPPEMLPPEYKQHVKQQEKIEKIAEENSQKEIPPEIQKMMDDTRKLQQMFSNVNTSQVPSQFLNN